MSAVAPVQALPLTGRTRLPILTFATTLAMITYIDRVCISQAAPFMQHDLGLSDSQMGLAFSAFAWAYALFEIPGGWLGDVIGPRKVLLRVVIFWSIFTAASGFVWGAISLVLVRFLFGMGEAGCFPNLTKSFMIWLPAGERTRAQSVTWLSARWAGAFTPLLVIWVISWVSWRNAFLLFAVLGLVWAYFFQRRFRRVSTEAPESFLETSKPMPWLNLFSSPTVWFLWIQYFCLTYGWFFYVTWLPTYLKETRGLQLDQNPFTLWLANILNNALQPETGHRVLVAILAGIPLFMGGFGALLAGWLTPRLAERFGGLPTNRIDSSPCAPHEPDRLLTLPSPRSRRRGIARQGNGSRWPILWRVRRALALFGFGGAAILLVLSFYIKDPLLGILAMGLASFCNDLTMPGSWSACMDIGGAFAGTLSGSMNMMGSIGAAVAPLVIGIVLDQTHRNWTLPFWFAGLAYAIGGLCWLWIKPPKGSWSEVPPP